MIVGCSQCGAKIDRTDERRFFACPFCKSSLVLEGDRTFGRLIMRHAPNDLWAKGVFLQRLTDAGVARADADIGVEFSYVPFWMIRRTDGTVTAALAAKISSMELGPVKVPPGRLVFFEENSRPTATVVDPTIPPEAVIAAGDVRRLDLVYLPLYAMRSFGGRGTYTGWLVGDSSRVYSDTIPVPKSTIPIRPLVFFAGAACLFVVAGLLFDEIIYRAAAIGAAALICLIVSTRAIGPGDGKP